MKLRLSPPRVATILIGIVIVLVIFSQIENYMQLYTDLEIPLLGFFNMDNERTIPSWYSVLLLASCSALLAIIGASSERLSRYWWLMSLVFAFLSLDEMLVLHEQLIPLFRDTFGTGGIFRFGWVIVAIPLVLLFVLVFSRFLLALPSHVRRGMILAGIIYISGALVLEMIGGAYYDANGADGVYLLGLTMIEETLEMIGIIWFIHVLLRYIGEQGGLSVGVE